MLYEVVNIAQQYKDGNIDSKEAMNSIASYIFPESQHDDVYIKRLVAFMWNIDISLITGPGAPKYPDMYAKTMYTKLLHSKHKVTSERLGEMIRVNHNTVRARIIAHDKYMFGDPEYKKIFNIINKIL